MICRIPLLLLKVLYESKETYQAEFESFRRMFLLLGGVLSFIVGMIGVLNFVNAILTGIITRKREFAMLQSIGMSGRQLKGMLVCEGLLYVIGAIVPLFVYRVVARQTIVERLRETEG